VPDPAGGSTLFLFFSRRPASIGGEFDLPPGLDGTSASIWVMTSRDDGATWAAARNITAGVKPADWAIMSFGPGRGLLTRWGTQAAPAGRIVAPGWYTSGTSTDEGDFVVLSDDGGQNFRLGGRTTGAGEPQVVELTDGTLLMDARNNPRKLFRSTDGGQTWSEPTDGLPMEPIMSSVVRHMAKRDGDPVDRLVHSGLGASGRVNIRAWQSLDEGATWTGETLLNHYMAQYSVLSVLDDRSIGMVYEGYGIIGEIFGPAIFFARFDVALLEKGVAASPAASALPVPARR